jgi:hypothetical protein
MKKTLLMVAGLLLVGAAIAMFLREKPPATAVQAAFTPRADASEVDRIADLEKALAAQVDRSNLLASRIGELETRVTQRADRRGPDGQDIPRDANGNIDQNAMRERMRETQLDRLVKAGFSRERAEWLEKRMQELQVQAQQAQFEAQKNGQPFRRPDTQEQLRKEIGDAEYEKLLTGMGQPTSVQVMDVLASSAAEKAGLKPGDQILSYAGTRVYDMNALNQLTFQGTAGEQVSVEVKRDGQTVQLQVPRGVLGLQGGGGPGGGRGPGGPGGFGGGPPGGFGGGRNGGGFGGGGGAPAGGNR